MATDILPTQKKILPGAQAKLERRGTPRLLPGASKPILPGAQAILEARGAKRAKAEPGFEGLEEVTAGEVGFEGAQGVAEPGFEGLKEADQIDLGTPETLAADDTFRPAQYLAETPEVTQDAEKFKKLLDAYRQKRVTGLEAGKVLKTAVKEAPGILAKTVKGAVQLGERAFDVALQPAANVILGAVSGVTPDELEGIQAETGKEQLRAAGEVTAGTEQAITGITQLGAQGARKLFGKSPAELTDDELYDQLLVDAEFHRATENIAKGQGEASKAVGLDAGFLQKNGIEFDQDAIANLSLVDPVTLVATAGVFKVVSTGGKILATAATRAGGEAVLNGLKTAAAKSIEVAGRGAELAGKGLQRLPLRTPSLVATGGQLAAGDVLGALGTAAAPSAVRAGGRALEATGRVAAEVGEQLRPGFVGPKSAGLTRISELAAGPAGQIAGGAARGAVGGAVAAAPLAAAAQDSETAGALLGGGVILGATAGGVMAGKQAVANAVAKRYLDPHSIPFEAVDSPGYGIDGNLDRTHEAAINALPETERNAINNFREAIRQQGGEIYVQDAQSFLDRVRESMQAEQGGAPLTAEQEARAKLYADSHAFFDGYLTDAAGQERRAIFLNSSAKGLPHDAGHLFQAMLAPEHQARLRQAVFDAYSPEQLKEFGDAYGRRLEDPGFLTRVEGEAARGRTAEELQAMGERAARNRIADELIAENFSQLFGNAKLSDLKAPAGFLDLLGRTAVEAAEALGIDLKAGRTTPDLAAQPSFRLQNILRNAAREVLNLTEAEPRAPFIKQAELELTPREVKPPKPGELPVAESPKTVTPEEIVSPEAPKAPAADETATRATERGVDVARELTKSQPEAAQTVETIAASMEAGNPVLRIEHRGITQEPGAPRETGRTPRRGTQEKGYAALEALQVENRKDAPPEIVSVHEKTFVPVRFVEQGGKATLIAMSMDKVLANIRRVVADANAKGAGDLIPYEQENGRLTEAGWNQALADLSAYAENQSHGYRGDGKKLLRPGDELGASIPAEDPGFSPTVIDEAKSNFANLIQGIAPPRTARMTKGQVPGNIKGQVIAELQGRTPEKPAVVRPQDLEKQAFGKPFEGRSITETNPLRNQLDERGVNTRALTEVTERLATEDIASVEPSKGPQIKAPVTDVIRGGFLPKDAPAAEIIDRVFGSTAEEWRKMFGPEQGMAPRAYEVGLGLKSPEELSALQAARERATEAGKAILELVRNGDMDALNDMSVMSTKAQFFREAIEAATDVGSAAGAQGWRKYFPDGKPPFAEAKLAAAPVAEKGRGEMERLFLPADEIGKDLDPIKMAAVRTKGGSVFTGSWHGEAHKNLADAFGRGDVTEPLPPGFKSLTELSDSIAEVGGPSGFVEDGFVTQGGKFLNRADALKHAERIQQLKAPQPESGGPDDWLFEAQREGVLESSEFERNRSFLPAEGERDFDVVWQPRKGGKTTFRQKVKATSAEEAQSKVVPKGAHVVTVEETFKPTLGTVGEGDLIPLTAENESLVRGRKLLPSGGEEPRTSLAKKLQDDGFEFKTTHPQLGYTRLSVSKDGREVGYLTAVRVSRDSKKALLASVDVEPDFQRQKLGEALYRELGATLQAAGFETLVGNLVGEGTVSLREKVFGPGNTKYSGGESAEETAARIERGGATLAESRIEPGRAFLPKPGTPEYNEYVAGRIEESKKFPEAIPLQANKDAAGNFKSEYGDEPNWVREPYALNETALAKENRGADVAESENKYTDALAKRLEEAYHEAKKNPAVEAGETWYSVAREKIQTLLGDDAQLFAELLGATSPQTAVDVNFGYALEAYNLFKRGYYDSLIDKYREGRAKFQAGELEEFTKETGKSGKKATEKAFLSWWSDKHGLEPTSDRVNPKTGKPVKFGFHTQPVLRVLDRSWLQQVEGPKTPNFTGNLVGSTFEATIDVWAARLMHRLSSEGRTGNKPWRILPPAETGVTDRDFFTGQKAFRKAGDALGVSPDALQAILWFFEKGYWEERGWTEAIGAAKADYNVLLQRTTKTPEGRLAFTKPEKPPKEKTPKKPKGVKPEDIEAQKPVDAGVRPGDIE